MRIKCADCPYFVPVDSNACRYCANCGAPLNQHPTITDVRAQVDLTKKAIEQLHRVSALLVMSVLGFAFLGVPLFPLGAQIFALIAGFLAYAIILRSARARIKSQYPGVFANESWQPEEDQRIRRN